MFGSHKSYLGVDIANSSIKVVEFSNDNGRPKLVTYGFIEEEVQILKSETPEAKERIVSAIKKILQEARVTTKKTVGALPSFTVFSSIISLPKMPRKDLVSAIRWEAKKFVPMPIDEMVLDWKVLNHTTEAEGVVTADSGTVMPSSDPPNSQNPSATLVATSMVPPPATSAAPATSAPEDAIAKVTRALSGNKDTIKVLLTAAPKKLVQRYVEIYKACDLELVSLETEAFALQRSLVGNDPSAIMVVDMGAVSCDISVMANKIPILNRSIDVGGKAITESIAKSLNVTPERAEQFKRDFGLMPAGSEGSDQVPKTIEFAVNAIMNEIRYVLNLYQSHGSRPIEKILLSGGSSFIPFLSQHIEKNLGLRVYIGDPWARVVYPVELKPLLLEIGPRMAVSIGLAMREIV